MSMTTEELAQAKAQLAKLNNKRIEAIIDKVISKPQPAKKEPAYPKQPADVSTRKIVRQIRRGCSGFFHPNFMSQ